MNRFQASLIAATFVAAASAQAQQAKALALVNVDLGTVANTIAKNLNVDVEKVPASLQVPVGVAATACGVTAARLTPATGTEVASCQAVSTNAALDQVVQRQLKAQPKQ